MKNKGHNTIKKIIYGILLLVGMFVFSQENEFHKKEDSLSSKSRDSIAKKEVFQFKNIGPSRGGRVTAVCGVQDSISTFYMGATGGGLWKTSDNGNHWKNISDGFFETPSIGAIAVDQSNPNIVYVGTGSDGIRSNVIVGKGIYKSVDAGKTWHFLGLSQAGQIGALEIDPINTNNIFAAVIGQPFRNSRERGIYKSEDAGKTWVNKLFVSDSVGAVDIEFAPKNPNIIYAAMWRAVRRPWTIISGDTTGGIFKSVDGGETWKKITKGLPQGPMGKIDFAVSEAKPDRVWALVQAETNIEGLYKSDDYGESWEYVPMPKKTKTSIMYRPFYFTNLSANPKNADELWSGTKVFWNSKDGGKSWKAIPSYPHADHHAMWINPTNPNVFICGNDGGASVSVDSGQNWSSLFNQSTAELYSMEVDDQYPYYLYSGQQDNSTIRVPSRRPREDVLSSNDAHGLSPLQYWESVGGCETGPVVPKPGNPNVVYTNCKGQFGVYDRRTGFQQNYYIGAESLYGNHPDDITYRFQRVAPIEVSPHNANVVYYGSQFVHKTIDGGRTWHNISPDLTANKPEFRMRSGGPIDEDISGEEYYNVLYAIEESPLKEGIIWAGSNDGLIHISKNGGGSWENITPESLPADGRVSKIHASKHQPGKAYVAVYRDLLGDDRPYAYKTLNYGKHWELITKGIPDDFPVRVIREDPQRSGLLFCGTEFGLFISFNGGEDWMPFQRNLPVVPITGLKIFRDNLNISTLGRSFWVLEDISVLRQFNPEDGAKNFFYTPKNTIYDTVNLYFSIVAKETDSIYVKITNERGKLIHSKYEKLADIPKDGLGLRKTQWDLRHYLKREGQKDFKGPKVAPGKYKVALKLKDTSITRSFNYELHPNLKLIGTTVLDLEEQELLALQTATLLLEVHKKRMQLESQLKAAKSNRKQQMIKAKIAALKKGEERYDKPMLEDHIDYLYKMISSAPQKLGNDAFERFKTLNEAFQEFLE
ncbi:WD40/YVTN/BNR-like repeat-containing protein [Spongiimicrobium sp. 3-5]|uniref:WD40/YVTN/BNR-like repeat-containing protein n=1 Tax=Spongiimicrobium sp. 3-5 TaxID=3332596 RepID=UPI0039803D8E